jgi:hypothetical protein
MVAAGRAGECRGVPEPERSPWWPERLFHDHQTPWCSMVRSRPGDLCGATCPPWKAGLVLGPSRKDAGRGTMNLMGVCDRNTSQGLRRSKPPGSWQTAKAERSGAGIPQRGAIGSTGASLARCWHRDVDSSSWERRRGKNLKGEWTQGRYGSRQPDRRCGRLRGRDPRERGKGQEWYPTGRETDRKAARWNTPGPRPQGRKGEGGAAKPT